ncbi:MAG: very short patch repair endonuclease [Candidatus Cryptobacteroides sp.]
MAGQMTAEEKRHYNMSRIRGKDTKPEMIVRRHLHRSGYRYRVNLRRLPGTPDIVLAKYRTVIFVNGCFWHGHKGCQQYTVPHTNTEFWVEKVRRNKERDELAIQRLESLSWSVITVWECELKPKISDETMARMESGLRANKAKWEAYCRRRREDREFAKAEARRKKAIREEVERELQEQFGMDVRVRWMSLGEED